MFDPNGEIDPDLNFLGNRFPDAQYMAPADMTGNFTKYKNLSNIMHINAPSVSSKMADLQIIMDQLPVSILALTETWLTEESEYSLVFLVIRLYVAQGQLRRAEGWPWSYVKTLYFIFLTSTLVQPIRLRISFCIYPPAEGSGLDSWGDLPTLGSTLRVIQSGNGNSSPNVSQTQEQSHISRGF